MWGLASRAESEWLARYERARADLLDGQRVLSVRTQLTRAADAPVVLGDVAPDPAPRAPLQARRIGVFAGSFNPQTVAHAAVADAARAAGRLDLLLWALARVTVDKERVERASLADRAIQLLAYSRAAAPDDAVLVLGAGLYADQAETMRRLIVPDAELWLIVGFDKVVQIFDPRYYADRDAALRRLFAAAGLLVAPRAGQGEADLAALLARVENRRFASGVRALPVPNGLAEVASTQARRLLDGDGPPDGAVSFDRLARVVTPEGAALGLATGAYQQAEPSQRNPRADRYAARLRWLDALANNA